MDKENKGSIESAMKHLLDLDLPAAIRNVKMFTSANPHLMDTGELPAIEDDFERMAYYMHRGYADKERMNVYVSLIQRLYTLAADLQLAYRKQNEPLMMTAASAVNSAMTDGIVATAFSHENIRHEMEDFVANVAMLQLETGEQPFPTGEQGNQTRENARKSHEKQLYSDHYRWMNTLFCKLLCSPQWRADDAEFYESLITSPTVETADAQLVTSAITLSCLAEMDIQKLMTLLHVYQNTSIEPIRQRAIVGFALSLNEFTKLYPQQEREINEACGDDQATVKELVDMQKQMIFCMNAERDKEDIQRNIIPTIVKNNNLSITRDGIIEKDEAADDIFGSSEDADKRMEEMEKSIQKMLNMQKEGSDIYFGGFSQMKRFPFFYTLSNWFTPFSTKHPALANASNRLSSPGILDNMMRLCPFCDSDKYSFALAMSTIIDKLPESIRKMLGNGNGLMPIDESIDVGSPAYIRRMYLQDLFRFFKLFPQRNSLRDPFKTEIFAFVTAGALRNKGMSEHAVELCQMFYKNNFGEALRQTAYRLSDINDTQTMIYRALYQLNYGRGARAAVTILRDLHEKEPGNDYAASLLARAYMETRQWRAALETYSSLYTRHPDNKTTAVNYCAALIKCAKFDKAAPVLFRLQFENADDINVMRLLAWTLMGQSKMEDADKQYAKLLSHDRHNANDCLNAAYCKWFIGDIAAAAKLFRTFLFNSKTSANNSRQAGTPSPGKSMIPSATTPNASAAEATPPLTDGQTDTLKKKLRKELNNDIDMLNLHNITLADRILMEHIVIHGN